MPPTARSAPRGVRRGALVLTAGPAPTGVTPPARWSRPYLIDRAGVLALFFRADPTEGREGLKTMTRMRQDLAARRRGELNRDRGSRQLSSAIDAQRHLNARRADSTRAKAHAVGPSDPRYAYLTRSYD